MDHIRIGFFNCSINCLEDDNIILFFGGEILIIFMEGGTPTSPFAENATKTINFFQPFPNSDELNTPKIYYLLFPWNR